ncbi:Epimerase domain-containing protein [Citrus sinensis]|uniref:Epimerase domain-containing protein n=1 Tax=Citrus sinensis TaxID=2711 RepID=A0ACB8KV41_CITSI|nr:Epimerase domain-containing protein [Citrus sinensis]
MKILVSGASGYLGGRLCHALLKQGHSVRALVRRTSDISGLPSEGAVELVYGDVTDYRSLVDACFGCHVIFHTAALVEPWLPDPSRFFAVNVEGLKNVVQAARETKTVEKIIYTSSFFALGSTDGYIADENQVHEEKYFCTQYERSKAVADKIALQAASEGLPIVPVYPGVIYGPGKLTTDGHIAAMEKGRSGERYLLTGENASFMQIFDMAAVITGTSRPRFCIPLWLIEAYGWILVFFSRITGKLPLISYPTVHVLAHQWAYSCVKAKTELGYNPRSLKEGLQEVLPWLRSSGMIKY